MQCALCYSETVPFNKFRGKEYTLCSVCKSVMMNSRDLINPEAEKKRYDNHNNDVTDLGYRNFVKPLVDLVVKNESISSAGLDYGAGPGPVISVMLN